MLSKFPKTPDKSGTAACIQYMVNASKLVKSMSIFDKHYIKRERERTATNHMCYVFNVCLTYINDICYWHFLLFCLSKTLLEFLALGDLIHTFRNVMSTLFFFVHDLLLLWSIIWSFSSVLIYLLLSVFPDESSCLLLRKSFTNSFRLLFVIISYIILFH